jgi:cell division protein FtsB
MSQAGGRAGRETPLRAQTEAQVPRSTPRPSPLRRARANRLTMPVAIVASLAIVLGAVLPLGSLLSVEHSLGSREAELSSLERTESALSAEVRDLQQPSVIDRLARERFGMVRKGQEALAIVPSGSVGGEQPAFARGFPGVPGAAASPAVPTTPLEATPPPLGSGVRATKASGSAVPRGSSREGFLTSLVHELESIF